MNFVVAEKYKKFVFYVVLTIVALFAASWVAGQCREWRTPKESPKQMDVGVPTPGPVNAAPTVPACLPVAQPDLAKEQELAILKKYGIEPSKTPSKPSAPETDMPVAVVSGKPLETIPSASSDARKIIPLAETTFTHEASGVSVDVMAFVMGFGQRVQQRAVWHPWKPPITITQDNEHWLGNEARWEKFVILGYVGMLDHDPVTGENKTSAAPGLGLGLAFKSWRFGHATLEGRGIGMFTVEGDGAAMGGLSLSW